MRATLLVVTLIVLAGCGGLAPAADSTPVTPAPVPTTAEPLPPGVTAHHVSPTALSGAHASSLAAHSYTLRTVQTIHTTDGERIRRTNHTRTVVAGAAAFAGRFHRDIDTFRAGQTTARVDYWTNGSTVYTRYRTGQSRSQPSIHRWQDRGAVPLSDLTERHHLQSALAATDVGVSRRLSGGGAVLTADRLVDREQFTLPLILSDPRNMTMRLRVRGDGIVTDARITYDATHSGVPVRVERRMTVSLGGSPSVETPGWVQNASFESEAEAAGYTNYWD